MEEKKTNRKSLVGHVVKLPKDKTLVVRVERKFAHPKYGKTVKSHKKYLVNFESDVELEVGQIVEIKETRPVSKRKSWEFTRVLESNQA